MSVVLDASADFRLLPDRDRHWLFDILDGTGRRLLPHAVRRAGTHGRLLMHESKGQTLHTIDLSILAFLKESSRSKHLQSFSFS